MTPQRTVSSAASNAAANALIVRRDRISSLSDDEVLLTTKEACILFGGPSRPIHPATLYRNLGGRYPRPVLIGANSVRWLRSECREALQRMMDARDKAA